MSKRRAIILAVTVEGLPQAEVARHYEVSESWVSRLVARYRTHGDEAFEPGSRRPHSSPTRLSDVLNETIVNLRIELVGAGLDAGPETIRWHLQQRHAATVSIATIRRRLLDAGLIEPQPRKRPRSSYIRFEADLPNECWQSDFTHCRLGDGSDREVIVWLDDHSRYALSITAHHRVTGRVVVDTFTHTATEQGFPASVLTDNGLVYTTRLSGGSGGRNGLETLLVELGIDQKHSRPNHPTTCGKGASNGSTRPSNAGSRPTTRGHDRGAPGSPRPMAPDLQPPASPPQPRPPHPCGGLHASPQGHPGRL